MQKMGKNKNRRKKNVKFPKKNEYNKSSKVFGNQ